jgi:pentatricopeptide repeat protein
MKQHFSSGNIPNNNEDYPNQKNHLRSEEEVQQQQQREDYVVNHNGTNVGDGNLEERQLHDTISVTNNRSNQRTVPDYGADFVPGAGPTKFAPKSLDHFQREHEERSNNHDRGSKFANRGTNSNNNHVPHHHHQQQQRYGHGGNNSSNNYNPGGRGNYYDRDTGHDRYNDRPHSHHHSGNGDRARISGNNNNGNDDPWNQQHTGNRDRPTILQGLDINALVDRLTTKLNNKDALFAELDRTRQENRNVFDNGKALTALISIAARRKNIGLGHAAWDWMDHAGIAKNTFHYNSMISVTEKARDYQYALALLQEMKDRGIMKNEVTYVLLQ